MKKFKCKACGSNLLEITYDATITYQGMEILKDDIRLSRHGEYDCDYYYLYARCGHCGFDLYEGKYMEVLVEFLENDGWIEEEPWEKE